MKTNKIPTYNPKLFPALSFVKPPDISEIQVSPFVKKAPKPTETADRAVATGKSGQLTNYFFTGHLGKAYKYIYGKLKFILFLSCFFV